MRLWRTSPPSTRPRSATSGRIGNPRSHALRGGALESPRTTKLIADRVNIRDGANTLGPAEQSSRPQKLAHAVYTAMVGPGHRYGRVPHSPRTVRKSRPPTSQLPSISPGQKPQSAQRPQRRNISVMSPSSTNPLQSRSIEGGPTETVIQLSVQAALPQSGRPRRLTKH